MAQIQESRQKEWCTPESLHGCVCRGGGGLEGDDEREENRRSSLPGRHMMDIIHWGGAGGGARATEPPPPPPPPDMPLLVKRLCNNLYDLLSSLHDDRFAAHEPLCTRTHGVYDVLHTSGWDVTLCVQGEFLLAHRLAVLFGTAHIVVTVPVMLASRPCKNNGRVENIQVLIEH